MRASRRQRGFTLIELLITVTIAAIVLTLAVPGFSAFIRSNRAEVQSSALVNSLNYARTEAVRRGAEVRVTSLGANNWHSGWRVWVDRNGNGAFDAASDDELRVQPALTGAGTLVGTAPQVIFNRLGNLDGVAAGANLGFAYRVGAEFCRLERDITVNHMGRVSKERRAC